MECTLENKNKNNSLLIAVEYIRGKKKPQPQTQGLCSLRKSQQMFRAG